VTTEERDYQRAFRKELRRRDRVSILVVQGEYWRLIARLQSTFGQSRPAQILRSSMKISITALGAL